MNMAYSTQTPPNVAAGYKEAFNGVSSMLANPDPTLVAVSKFLNGCIRLLLTFTIIILFIHLIIWVLTKQNSDARNTAIKGAIRCLAALFIMVNFWSMFWTFSFLLALSNVTAYLVFLSAFLIFGFWSLFSLGDNFVRLCAFAAEWILDIFILGLRNFAMRFGFMNERIQRMSQNGLRFFVFATLVLILSTLTFVWSATSVSQTAVQSTKSSVWQIVESKPEDVSLVNGWYQNKALNFSVQFPATWQVTTSTAQTEDPFAVIMGRSTSTAVIISVSKFAGPISGTSTVLRSQLYPIADNMVTNLEADGSIIPRYDLHRSGQLVNAPAFELNLETVDPSGGANNWNTLIFESGRNVFKLSFVYPNSRQLSKSELDEMRSIVESIQLDGSKWTWVQ